MTAGEDSRFASFLWLFFSSLVKFDGCRALPYLSSGLSESRLRLLAERPELPRVLGFRSGSLLEPEPREDLRRSWPRCSGDLCSCLRDGQSCDSSFLLGFGSACRSSRSVCSRWRSLTPAPDRRSVTPPFTSIAGHGLRSYTGVGWW